MRFDTLNLDPKLLDAIHEMGYERCTPVQEQSLPESLNGHDIAAQAQTGTGKTAVFLITVLQRMILAGDAGGSLRALILVPTRELAVQVEEQARLLCKHLHYRSISVYGGVGYDEQERALAAGAEIVVATPGRLIDYLKGRKVDLSELGFFIIDEADRMFDMGFMDDVKYILRHAPPKEKRQTLLVSATLDDRVRELAYHHMRTPVEIEIEPDQITVEKVTQKLFHVSREEKIPLLITLLRGEGMERVLIFTNMKRTAEDVGYKLDGNGFPAEVLTGDIDQKKRLKIIERMKDGQLHILVATDVAARGLHIEGITHVINFDLPADAANYVHRIGRTARAGATGTAYTLACEEFVENLPSIERYIEQKIEVAPIDFELAEDAAGNRPRGRGRGFGDRSRGPGRGERPRGDRPRGHGPGGERPRSHSGPRRDGPPRGRDDRPGHAAAGGPSERHGRRPEARHDTPKPHKGMSDEERMAVYRKKYGDSFGGKAPEPSAGHRPERPHGERGAQARREGEGRKKDFRHKKGKPRHPDAGAKVGGQKDHRGPKTHHKEAAHGHAPAKKEAKKGGLLNRLLGVFKKKSG